MQSDAAATLSTFLTYSNSSGKIFVEIANPINTGVYKLKVVATEPVSGLQNSDITFTLTLTCTTKLFKNTEVNVKNIAYVVPADLNSLPVKMVLPVYKTDPEYCLLQPYTIMLLDDSTASTQLPGFLTVDKTSVTIFNKDPAITGKFVFRFVATEPRFGLVDRAVTFSVTITCTVGKIVAGASDVSDIVYVLRTAPYTFKIPKYSSEPSACETVLSYKLENASAGGSADSLPKFV